jgi:hypothetical protein
MSHEYALRLLVDVIRLPIMITSIISILPCTYFAITMYIFRYYHVYISLLLCISIVLSMYRLRSLHGSISDYLGTEFAK